jgi:multiple antibiotic resistance protein
MCAAIFVQIEAGKSPGAQLGSATKVALAVLIILTVAALVGVKVLHLFGVSLDAFMVAGGGVLAWLGFSMLRGLPPGPPAAAKPEANPSLTPLILFAASPGTITGVIALSVAHAKSGIPVIALVAVAVATSVMWLLILIVARLGGRGSGGFVHDTVTRFMGLIVIAMGVQFSLSGVRAFMLEPADMMSIRAESGKGWHLKFRLTLSVFGVVSRNGNSLAEYWRFKLLNPR